MVWTNEEGVATDRPATLKHLAIWAITFSADGKTLATGSFDSSARVFDATTGEPKHEFHSLETHFRRVYLTADGSQLIAVGHTRKVIVFDLAERPGMLTMRGHQRGVNTTVYSPDGTRILSASDDGTARIWNREGQTLAVFKHRIPLKGARWARDEQRIVTVLKSGAVQVWSIDPNSTPKVIETEPAFDAWFDADDRLVTVSRSGSIQHWGTSLTDVVREFTPSEDGSIATSVTCTAWTADGTALAVGYDRGEVSLVTFGNQSTMRSIRFESKHPRVPVAETMALAFSPSGRFLAVGCKDTCAHVYETGSLVLRGTDSHATPNVLAFNPSESQVMVGGRFGGSLRIAAIEEKGLQFVERIQDHPIQISAAAFSSDGKLFMSASADREIRLYRAKDRRNYALLVGHEDKVTTALFSPDGQSILSASLDGTLRIWPVDALQLAMHRMPRQLTTQESVRLKLDLAGN